MLHGLSVSCLSLFLDGNLHFSQIAMTVMIWHQTRSLAPEAESLSPGTRLNTPSTCQIARGSWTYYQIDHSGGHHRLLELRTELGVLYDSSLIHSPNANNYNLNLKVVIAIVLSLRTLIGFEAGREAASRPFGDITSNIRDI
jgi:hypothetical protein